MDRSEILNWLREDDPARLEALWERADFVRRVYVRDTVFLRALVELSNYCRRMCHYCGLRAANTDVNRYRLSFDEAMQCVRQVTSMGLGTVVLQAGEDPGLTIEFIDELVRAIKSETGMAVTLSLGERSETELAAWREAGADRYLLRFETSNSKLFNRIHPPHPAVGINRLALLDTLRRLDYEVGSGVMVGIPGQSFDDLVDDIELFRTLDLDMIGVGPFLPHPQTPLATAPFGDVRDQVHATPDMTYKVIALTRIVCPYTNIPSTTALALLDPVHGRELGLRRGANIVMPNFTPALFRALYEIYPQKAQVQDEAEISLHRLERRILSMGRTIGVGRGDSPHRVKRRASALITEGACHD